MSQRKIKVEEFTCDSCENVALVHPDDDTNSPLNWFTGTVYQHHSTGGGGGNWVACSEACVLPAITKAIYGS